MTDLSLEIDRLQREGVRFSIAADGDGFVVRVGNYLDGQARQSHVQTLEEAVRWIVRVSRPASPRLALATLTAASLGHKLHALLNLSRGVSFR